MPTAASKLSSANLKDNRVYIQYKDTHLISFSTVYVHLRLNWFFSRILAKRGIATYICIYLSVQEQEEAKLNSLLKGFEMRLFAWALCAQNTAPRCWIQLVVFLCMFKLAGVCYLCIQVQEDVKESIVWCLCTLCAHAALCVCTIHSLDIHSFECLNWRCLKTCAID